MKPDPKPGIGQLVRHGVTAYAQVLGAAGGRELDALMRSGDRGAVCAAIYASPPYDLQVPPLPVARVSLNLTQSRVSGGVAGERPRSHDALRYSMFYVPAGMPMAWRKDSPSRHLNIYFHPQALDEAGEGRPGFDAGSPIFNAQVAGCRQFADQLAAELEGDGPFKLEAADSLARLLLVRLARQAADPQRAHNPLTPRTLALLREYVLAHLSERILVADLAREAGLPPHRFAQAFTERMRQSPHQFVLSLRLERAAQLLRGSDLNLVAVAHDCGFANQQHLCNALRRRVGVTPGRYRQQHRALATE